MLSSYILIVNDDPETLEILSGVSQRALPDWKIYTADSEQNAYEIIKELGDQIRIAIVDLHLSVPENKSDHEGLRILEQLKTSASRCFTILCSKSGKSADDLSKLAPTEHADCFVSLRYIDEDPIEKLNAALNRAYESASSD